MLKQTNQKVSYKSSKKPEPIGPTQAKLSSNKLTTNQQNKTIINEKTNAKIQEQQKVADMLASTLQQKINKVNFKQLHQVKLMIRPKMSIIHNVRALYIIFQKCEVGINIFGKPDILVWQQLQTLLNKYDLLNLLNKFKQFTQQGLITLTHLQEAQDVLKIHPTEQTLNKMQWNYEMELLQVCLQEATEALIQYVNYYHNKQSYRPSHVQQVTEDELELPHNFNIKMEHLQQIPVQPNLQEINNDKKTPRTILKNGKHSKTSSQSTVQSQTTTVNKSQILIDRPNTSTGFHTPMKQKNAYSHHISGKSQDKISHSVRSSSSNSQSSSKKYFLGNTRIPLTSQQNGLNHSTTSNKVLSIYYYLSDNNIKVPQGTTTNFSTSQSKIGKIINLKFDESYKSYGYQTNYNNLNKKLTQIQKQQK